MKSSHVVYEAVVVRHKEQRYNPEKKNELPCLRRCGVVVHPSILLHERASLMYISDRG